MSVDFININQFEEHELFKKLLSLNLINDTAFRNMKIKQEYNSLKKNHSMWDSLELLGEKYHLSYDQLKSIIHRKHT